MAATHTRALALFGLLAAAAHASDQLVLVSPHWEGMRYEFADGFRRRYKSDTGRDADLKWLDLGGTSDIVKFIRSEFRNKPSGIGVDLLFGGGTDPYLELKKHGQLAPYRVPDEILRHVAPTLNGVPLYDPELTWYSVTMAGFGIVYNKVVLRRLGLPEPTTWEDLARPQVFSWVGSADPRRSGSVHMAYEIILQAYGWERGWQVITALGANVRGFSTHSSQTPKDVAVGEVAYGLAIDSYAWHQVKEAGEEMIGYVMPEDLTVVNGDAIGILKGAPNRPLAERFINFALSEEGQKLLLLRQGEPDGPRRFELGKFSVLPGLYAKAKGRTPVQVNPFEWRSQFVYDAAKGSARYELINNLIGTQIIDAHDRLASAWRQAIRRGTVKTELPRLAAVPLDEEQAQELIRTGRWKDPVVRSQMIREWAAHARGRYGAGVKGMDFVRNLPALVALVVGVLMVVYLRRRGPRAPAGGTQA